MADPLVLQYGPAVPRKIGTMLAGAVPGLSAEAFVNDALQGYYALPLMARGDHMARACRRCRGPGLCAACSRAAC